jgi:hypothetical protein
MIKEILVFLLGYTFGIVAMCILSINKKESENK